MEIFERISKIMTLKNDGLSFSDIGESLGLSRCTINENYLIGEYIHALKEKGIDLSQYTYTQLKEMRQQAAADRQQNAKSSKKKLSNKDILITAALNEINTGLRLMTRFRDMAEKVMRLMRLDYLEKHSQETQEVCFDIMCKLMKFLSDQVDERKTTIYELNKSLSVQVNEKRVIIDAEYKKK